MSVATALDGVGAPAAIRGVQALLLLFVGEWGGVHETDDLVEQLLTDGVVIRLAEPVLAIVRAGPPVATVACPVRDRRSLGVLVLGNRYSPMVSLAAFYHRSADPGNGLPESAPLHLEIAELA